MQEQFYYYTAEAKMTRKTISKERSFSFSDMPVLKLRREAKVKVIGSAARLKDQELVFNALWQCLVDQDIESFKDVLRGHLEAVNKQKLSKKAKTSRRTLHRILSAEGNPTLKSISKIISAMYG
jgi:DNA-binding phage protein